MKKRKFLLTATLGVLACGMLTSCDYSNFSLFGAFYNIWLNGVKKESEDNKTASNNTSSNSSTSNNTESTTFVPQTYMCSSTYTVDTVSIDKYQVLALLNETEVEISSYEYATASDGTHYTYKAYVGVANYTRDVNKLDLTSLGLSVYTDFTEDSSNPTYISGSNEETRKNALKSAFGSDSTTITLKENSTFVFGESETSTTALTGLSTAHTYYYYELAARKTYKTLTLLDDGTAFISSFSSTTADKEIPASAFVGKTTYEAYPDKDTTDYEAIKLSANGVGNTNVTTNGIFDMMDETNFTNWYKLCYTQKFSLKITKIGYTNSVGDELLPYYFECFDDELDDNGSDTPDVETEEYFTLIGQKKDTITLKFNKDHTYEFAFSDYNFSEKGTWEYDSENDTITCTYTKDDTTKVISFTKDSEGDGYTIDFKDASGQLTQTFTMTAEQMEILKENTYFTLIGQKKDTITLKFNKDHTYEFAFSDYNFTEEGTWEYDGENDTIVCTYTKDDTTKVISFTKDSDGKNYTIDFKNATGQLTQTFTMTSSQKETLRNGELFTLKGQKLSTITLKFYEDHTYEFAFPKYKFSEKGTWAYDGINETITCTLTPESGDPKVISFVKDSEGDGYTIDFKNTTGQLTQTFKLSSTMYKKLKGDEIFTLAGQKLSTITLKFNEDHTYEFAFSTYKFSEKGTWAYDSENDTIVCTYTKDDTKKVISFTKDSEGDGYTIDFKDTSGQLTQTFKMSNELKERLRDGELFTLAGQKLSAITLRFNYDHTYIFAFSTYGFSEKGTWSYDSTTSLVTCTYTPTTGDAKVISFTKDSEGDGYTINFKDSSGQLTQTFKMTKDLNDKLAAIA